MKRPPKLLRKAPIPDPVLEVLSRLETSGHEAFIVGGWVRDTLLGRDTGGDFDITTSARPEEVVEVFDRVIPTGIEFGTVTVVVDGFPVEVTTYRTEEGYSDSRHPDEVKFTRSLEEDLARRDFTINAFAYSPVQQVFVDAFGGLLDLERRTIRTVGDPQERFREDALRLMRAVRFCATLEFSLETQTQQAIRTTSRGLERVAGERIQKELWKLLRARKPSRGLGPMYETGLWRLVLPQPKLAVSRLLRQVDLLPPDPVLRLAAILDAGTADESAERLKRLKLPRKDLQRLGAILSPEAYRLATARDVVEIRRAAAEVGRQHLEDVVVYYNLQHVPDAIADTPLSIKELAISGHDLVEIGLPPGPQIGQCLRLLFAWVLEDPQRNTRANLLQRARSCL